jgi:hypothetical protein
MVGHVDIQFQEKQSFHYALPKWIQRVLQITVLDINPLNILGITYDGKKSVFIPDTFANYVKRFTLDENGKKVLTYAETIETNGGGDNVEYDEATNKIYIGLIHKKIHHFTVTKFNFY